MTNSDSDDDPDSHARLNKLLDEQKERDEKKQMRIDAHNKLFSSCSSQSTKKIKRSDTRDDTLLSQFVGQTINLRPVSITGSLKRPMPLDQKYNMYLVMSECGEEVIIPSTDDIAHVDKLKQEYIALKNMDPEPSDYYERATLLKDQIDDLEPLLKKQTHELGDAVLAYHTAVAMQEDCKSKDQVKMAKGWKSVEDALAALGVADWIKNEQERRKQEKNEKEAAKAAAMAAEGAAERKTRALAAGADKVIVIDGDAEQSNNSAVAMVKDSQGKSVPPDSILQPGKLSTRDRENKPKSRSIRLDTKRNRGMRNTIGWERTDAQLS